MLAEVAIATEAVTAMEAATATEAVTAMEVVTTSSAEVVTTSSAAVVRMAEEVCSYRCDHQARYRECAVRDPGRRSADDERYGEEIPVAVDLLPE